MSLEGTRRVMETNSHETANQYLRFGWILINQYTVEATVDQPSMVKYVLASVRRLEDTRQLIEVIDTSEVNAYLSLGWKLIDKFVTSTDDDDRRHETPHYVLAWQSDDPAQWPPGKAPAEKIGVTTPDDVDDEL